jgi:hypothetical protein
MKLYKFIALSGYELVLGPSTAQEGKMERGLL